jgi:hypothetical protein
MPPRSNGSQGLITSTADIVNLCLKYTGVEPRLDPEYDRTQVRLNERIQSRFDKNNAPDFMVKRYAHQMAESSFPPPLYTEDHIPIDGNTRTKAYMLREIRYIPAYILPISGETADAPMRDRLIQLSLALNAKNGKPLDVDEMMHFAELLIRDNHNDEDVVGNTGLALSKITMLRAQLRAKDRLIHLGHDVSALKLSDTALRAFGKANAMRLDDESYNGLLRLNLDAGLKAGEINALATSLNGLTSADSRSERLARERDALQPTITARRSGQEHPMLTEKLRKLLELLLGNPITAFVEGNLERAADYVEMLDQAIAKLGEIQTLQQSQPAAAATAEATAVH